MLRTPETPRSIRQEDYGEWVNMIGRYLVHITGGAKRWVFGGKDVTERTTQRLVRGLELAQANHHPPPTPLPWEGRITGKKPPKMPHY